MDGNLILYHVRSGGHILWSTDTVDPRIAFGIMQEDGNFVTYSQNKDIVFWSTATYGNPGSFYFLQDDGNMVVKNRYGDILWTSNTESTCSSKSAFNLIEIRLLIKIFKLLNKIKIKN